MSFLSISKISLVQAQTSLCNCSLANVLTALIHNICKKINIFHARIKNGDRESRTSLENHKAIGFLSNTGSDPLEYHKATCTKPAFNVGTLSVH